MNVSVNGQICFLGYHKDPFLIRLSLFYFKEYIYIASYADDSTHNADSDIENTISSLESSSA